MRSIELFAGAGGLGMGAALSGFSHEAVIEWDRWACDTIRENKKRDFPLVRDWNLIEGDVREFDFSQLGEGIDLLTAGPPCQPFSLGGKHRAYLDSRDMFPATIEAIGVLKPSAFLVENVKGLTREKFTSYLEYVLLRLTYPEVAPRKGEVWVDHLSRLEKMKTSGRRKGVTYEIVFRVLNSADYGVPQRRERVFIVGFRNDLRVEWHFPDTTHSLDSLLKDQWISGEYWDRLEVTKRKRPSLDSLPKIMRSRVEKIRGNGQGNSLKMPWRTVRDTLHDMPEPGVRKKQLFHNHALQPGARTYPGHTGSPIDLPAKTLKAGDHGVPGGENMLLSPDGQVRYFSVREAARLQTFPDGYVFHGSWTETMRQLGNAVPVSLARILTGSIAETLAKAEAKKLERTLARQEAAA